MATIEDLFQLIQSEHVSAQRLRDTLGAERVLLEERDLAGMQAILEQKAAIMTDLEAIRQRRNSCLNGLGLNWEFNNPSPEQVEPLRRLNGDLTDRCLEALAELNTLLAECRRSNELNGLLIVNSRKRNRRRMEILKGIESGQTLYDASGQATPAKARSTAQRA